MVVGLTCWREGWDPEGPRHFIQMTQTLHNYWASDKCWSASNINSNLHVQRASVPQYPKQAGEDFNTGGFPCTRHTALKQHLCTQPNTCRGASVLGGTLRAPRIMLGFVVNKPWSHFPSMHLHGSILKTALISSYIPISEQKQLKKKKIWTVQFPRAVKIEDKKQ